MSTYDLPLVERVADAWEEAERTWQTSPERERLHDGSRPEAKRLYQARAVLKALEPAPVDGISAEERARMEERAVKLREHGGALNVMSVAVLRLLAALKGAERERDDASKTVRMLWPLAHAALRGFCVEARFVTDAMDAMDPDLRSAVDTYDHDPSKE